MPCTRAQKAEQSVDNDFNYLVVVAPAPLAGADHAVEAGPAVLDVRFLGLDLDRADLAAKGAVLDDGADAVVVLLVHLASL